MASRLSLLCDWCDRPFTQVVRHWTESKCGPRDDKGRKAARRKARIAAHSLTKSAAVISEEELQAFRTADDPLTALCRHLGTKVVPPRSHQRGSQMECVASTSAAGGTRDCSVRLERLPPTVTRERMSPEVSTIQEFDELPPSSDEDEPLSQVQRRLRHDAPTVDVILSPLIPEGDGPLAALKRHFYKAHE